MCFPPTLAGEVPSASEAEGAPSTRVACPPAALRADRGARHFPRERGKKVNVKSPRPLFARKVEENCGFFPRNRWRPCLMFGLIIRLFFCLISACYPPEVCWCSARWVRARSPVYQAKKTGEPLLRRTKHRDANGPSRPRLRADRTGETVGSCFTGRRLRSMRHHFVHFVFLSKPKS